MKTKQPNSTALTRRIKQHLIGKKQRFFAIVQPGFEETARKELEEIGVWEFLENIEGGVEFSAKMDLCYRVNLCSRTITRLLMRLTSFSAIYFNQMTKKVSGFPWELYVKEGAKISFSIKSTKSRLHHSEKIQEGFRKGIRSRLEANRIKVQFLDKPLKQAAHKENQVIFIRFERDKCFVSLDSSGGYLYRRGRKTHASKAPIRETLAAMILREAGWPDYDALVDPMCGSASFALEACEMMSGRFPNMDRGFAFMFWPCFREASFRYHKKKLLEDQENKSLPPKKIYSMDLDPDALEAADKNIEESGFADSIRVIKNDFLSAEKTTSVLGLPKKSRYLMVINPPYGKRLSASDTKNIFRKIGNNIRHHFKCSYAIIVPGLEYEKILSLSYDKKILFRNGGIKVSVIIKR